MRRLHEERTFYYINRMCKIKIKILYNFAYFDLSTSRIYSMTTIHFMPLVGSIQFTRVVKLYMAYIFDTYT